MADQIRVFISSTYSDYRFDREYVAMQCRQMGLEPRMYPDMGTAGARKDYLEVLQECDVMVLLIPARDSDAVAEEIRLARANGIPFVPLVRSQPALSTRGARLAKRQAEYLRENRVEHISDYESLDQLGTAARDGIARVIHRRFTSPMHFVRWTSNVYQQAARFLYLAGSRVAIAQQTSTLVLGPKKGRIRYENEFYTEFLQRIKEAVEQGEPRILHVFDGEATADEWNGHKDQYPRWEEAQSELRGILPSIKDPGQVKIACSKQRVTAAMVGDASFQVCAMYGNRHYAWVHEFASGANELWEILDELAEDRMEMGDYLDRFANP